MYQYVLYVVLEVVILVDVVILNVGQNQVFNVYRIVEEFNIVICICVNLDVVNSGIRIYIIKCDVVQFVVQCDFKIVELYVNVVQDIRVVFRVSVVEYSIFFYIFNLKGIS